MIVRVNDRGPYHGGRVMDVSQRVAEALDFKGQGTARIRVEYIGRAGLGGSDDGKLMATLRTDGGPAQTRRHGAGVPTMLADALPPPPTAAAAARRAALAAGRDEPPGRERPSSRPGCRSAAVRHAAAWRRCRRSARSISAPMPRRRPPVAPPPARRRPRRDTGRSGPRRRAASRRLISFAPAEPVPRPAPSASPSRHGAPTVGRS